MDLLRSKPGKAKVKEVRGRKWGGGSKQGSWGRLPRLHKSGCSDFAACLHEALGNNQVIEKPNGVEKGAVLLGVSCHVYLPVAKVSTRRPFPPSCLDSSLSPLESLCRSSLAGAHVRTLRLREQHCRQACTPEMQDDGSP